MGKIINNCVDILKKVPWKWVVPTAVISAIAGGSAVAEKKDKEQHEKDLLTAKAIQKESAVNDALTAENHYLNDLNEILKEELINRVSGDDENE